MKKLCVCLTVLLTFGLAENRKVVSYLGTTPERESTFKASGASPYQSGKPSPMLMIPIWQVVDSFTAPGSYHMGMTHDGTYLWNASNATTPSTVYQIDPTNGNVVNQWQMSSGGYCLGITYFQGYLWIADFSNGIIHRYQTDGTPAGTYSSPAGTNHRGLANDGTYIWIANTGGGVGNGTLIQWDPSTGNTIRTVSIGSILDWPMGMTYDTRTGNMWINDDNGASSEINEVDISGANGVIVAQYPAIDGYGNVPEGIAFDGGTYLYFVSFYGTWIYEILAGTFADDMAAAQILSPPQTIIPYNPIDIVGIFKNQGQNPAGPFNVYAEVESLGVQIYSSSQTINSLAPGAADTITFTPAWTPAEFTYDLIVYHDYADSFAGNDTTTLTVTASFGEWICYSTEPMVNAWAFYDAGNAWGVQFTPSVFPYYVDSARVYILSEGDPYWPWPDAVHQDFQISIFTESGGQPGTEVFAETVNVLTDTIGDTSWVYVAPRIRIDSGDFWVGNVQLTPYPGCEGQGTDGAENFPSRNWYRVAGAWSLAGLGEDLMMCAYVRYPAAYDIVVLKITQPTRYVPANSAVPIEAIIFNDGLNPVDDTVEASIDSAGVTIWTDTVVVPGIQVGDTAVVSFASFNTGAGGIDYTLTVTSLLSSDGNPGNDQLSMLFTSMEVQRIITVPVRSVVPVIDGFIDTTAEWQDAVRVDVSDVFEKQGELNELGSAFLYLKYDGDYLYAAVRALFDVTRTEYDRAFFYFDDDNDGSYPPPGDDSEGRVALYYTPLFDALIYTPFYLDGTSGSSRSVGFPSASAMPAGYEQYELAIPFGTDDEKLDIIPPDTLGLFFQAADSGLSSIEIGAWWPQDVDTILSPSFYGKLIFPVFSVKEGTTPISVTRRLEFSLDFPTPLRGNEQIRFSIPYQTPVSIKVYNASGERVETLVERKEMTPGVYSIPFDGNRLSSGVYFVRLETKMKKLTRKLLLVK